MQYDAASVARLGRPATAWADPELVAAAPDHAVLAAQPFAAAQHAVEALAHHPPAGRLDIVIQAGAQDGDAAEAEVLRVGRVHVDQHAVGASLRHQLALRI